MGNVRSRSNEGRPIGVYADAGTIYLFSLDKNLSSLHIEISTDGQNFSKFKDNVSITDKSGKKVSVRNVNLINVSKIYDNYFLAFKSTAGGGKTLYTARGEDFSKFKKIGKAGIDEIGVLVPNYKYRDKYVMYWGENFINTAYSNNLKDWERGNSVLKPYRDFFGEVPVRVGNVITTDEGILLIYFVIKTKEKQGTSLNRQSLSANKQSFSTNKISHFEIDAVILDRENPEKILRHVDSVIWESPEEWALLAIRPLGIVKMGENLVSYWEGTEGVFCVFHPYLLIEKEHKGFPLVILHKLRHNPIIRPIIEHFWESKATFNPAAIYENGKVHIIYRAIGEDDVSVLGYAASSDGLTIDERLDAPIYVPTQSFEVGGNFRRDLGPSPFASGGGAFGGCEDPRITKIDDRIYMTYVAYDGYNPPRVAITSIDANDFLNHRWNWRKPVLISKPGVTDKNACLLSEKIGGKYVIFHRIFPDILIDFVDNLEFDGRTFLAGEFKISPREKYWDSRKVGVGAPPIKTDSGWLLVYQAVGDADVGRYKMGAMLLDPGDLTRVLARSNAPILEPNHWYENDGFKAGVVYPCGAVTINKKLIVYYGAADTVACVASYDLDKFVKNLKYHQTLRLTPTPLRFVN